MSGGERRRLAEAGGGCRYLGAGRTTPRALQLSFLGGELPGRDLAGFAEFERGCGRVHAARQVNRRPPGWL